MAKYRKILIAYDGSDSAKSALAVTGQIAHEDNCWVKALAVVPSYEGDLELTMVSNIREAIQGPGLKLLEEAKESAKEMGVHILTNLEQGEPYDRIVHVAEDEKCDLIVLGRRGISHLERELMGGVTARVIGHTTKDVLVVPEQVDSFNWKSIVMAVDGSKSCESAIERGIEIAGNKGAELHLISVVYTNDELLALASAAVEELVHKANDLLSEIEAKAKEKGIEIITTTVREGEPHEAIVHLTNETKAGLIIMGSHGRKGLTRLLMGSVTERTIGYSSCPVLVAH